MSSGLIFLVVEAALRAALGALAVWCGLRLLRVRNVPAQKAAWGMVLAAAMAMPLVMRWHWLPAPVSVTLPGWHAQQATAPEPRAASVAPLAATTAKDLGSLPRSASADSLKRLSSSAKGPRPGTFSGPANAAPFHSQIGSERARQLGAAALETSAAEGAREQVNQKAWSGGPSEQRSATLQAQPSVLTPHLLAAAGEILYFAMCAVLLVRLLWGLGVAMWLWLQAAPIGKMDGLDLSSSKGLRSSRRIAAPINVGSGVLLPADYENWDENKLRAVLAHERSHIRQGDFYLQALAGLYAAIFWFSPLGWWLKRKLTELGEAISDRAGSDAAASCSSYAQILLEFAALPRPTLTGVAMARRSNLSHRIEQLMNEAKFRHAFAGGKRRGLLVLLLVPAVLLASTAMVRVQAAGAGQASPPSASSAQIPQAPTAGKSNPAAPSEAAPAAASAPAPQAAPAAAPAASGVHVDVPAVHVDIPAIHLDLPGNHIDVPAIHVDVPEQHFDVPAVHVDVPAQHIDVPAVKVDVPAQHIDVPAVHVDVPAKQVDVPATPAPPPPPGASNSSGYRSAYGSGGELYAMNSGYSFSTGMGHGVGLGRGMVAQAAEADTAPELDARIAELQARLAQVKAGAPALEARIAELQENLKTMEAETPDAEAKIAEVQAELQVKQAEMQAAAPEIQADIAQLRARLAMVEQAAPQEQTFDRTLTVSGKADLTVGTGSGNIHLTRGAAGQVKIHGIVHAGSGASADEVQQIIANPPIEQDGNTIRVGEHGNEHWHNISISYEIEAPADTALKAATGSGNIVDEGVGNETKLNTGSGNINATGLQGMFAVMTGSGDIHLEQTGSGDGKAQTGSGNMEIKDVQGGLDAMTGSGDIKASGTPSSPWKLRSGSGSIELWAGNAPITLDASVGSGEIHTDHEMVTQGTMENKHHIVGKINGGGTEVRVETGSGDIAVH